MKNFLQENDFSSEEIKDIFTHAFAYKANRAQRPTADLAGQTWGMLFHKKSTRTRVSFEVGIRELGGNPLILDQSSTQIGRGESIEDTVKVLSRFLDGLIIRTHGHDIIEEFANLGSIPVVNALTDFLHPCQIFADCMTILEKRVPPRIHILWPVKNSLFTETPSATWPIPGLWPVLSSV
jgi:ornithine carbamoyltransferase